MIGQDRQGENVRKRLKIFENIRKYSKNDAKRLKIFENIRKFTKMQGIFARRSFRQTSADFHFVTRAVACRSYLVPPDVGGFPLRQKTPDLRFSTRLVKRIS